MYKTYIFLMKGGKPGLIAAVVVHDIRSSLVKLDNGWFCVTGPQYLRSHAKPADCNWSVAILVSDSILFREL